MQPDRAHLLLSSARAQAEHFLAERENFRRALEKLLPIYSEALNDKAFFKKAAERGAQAEILLREVHELLLSRVVLRSVKGAKLTRLTETVEAFLK